MYDLIIIGGGPAGLTAAVYALRKRLNVLLVSTDLGGKTNYHLELPDEETHWVIRGGDLVSNFKRELDYLKFARHMEPVVSVKRHGEAEFAVYTKGGGELLTRAIIVATGAHQQWLDVPGEKEYLGRGVSYSAVSHAPLLLEKQAVVVGNGELALRSAAELATVAESVVVVGPAGEVLTSPLGQKVVAAPNVRLLPNYQVVALHGNGFCNRVVVQDPAGHIEELAADCTFVEQALLANSELVAGLVETDERGFIKVDPYSCTSVPGIFAAGDVTNIFAEQVLVAAGEGAKAALSAYNYLLPYL